MSNAFVQPKYITPPNKIKEKVGGGGIAPERLKRAQEHINNNDVDFIPYARSFIQAINTHIAEAKKSKHPADNKKMIEPIMHLKANGGMFKYTLISRIADICLNFVESVDEMSNDAYDVVQAHVKTITIITNNKMSGSGGKEGMALMKELQKACDRYFAKHPPKKPPKNPE